MYPRISARAGSVVNLDVTFNRGGVPTDPYALYKVSIYKTQILPHNLVAEFVLPGPCETGYPSPIEQLTTDVPEGDCGTDPVMGELLPGQYRLPWDIPADAETPSVYFDVWTYFPTNPCLSQDLQNTTLCGDGDCPDLSLDDFADYALQSCNRFWVYPDGWHVTDGLQSIRLGFEPLDQKFNQPEIRPLEVAIMPLPLYDYNFNLNMPIMPLLTASIHIETMYNEVLVDDSPMTMGIRQGSYRTNPYVLRYLIDSKAFLKGSYKYRITVDMPDGTTRSSKDYIFTVS